MAEVTPFSSPYQLFLNLVATALLCCSLATSLFGSLPFGLAVDLPLLWADSSPFCTIFPAAPRNSLKPAASQLHF